MSHSQDDTGQDAQCLLLLNLALLKTNNYATFKGEITVGKNAKIYPFSYMPTRTHICTHTNRCPVLACERSTIVVHHMGQREGIYSSFVTEVHNDLKVTEGRTNTEKACMCIKNEIESERKSEINGKENDRR